MKAQFGLISYIAVHDMLIGLTDMFFSHSVQR